MSEIDKKSKLDERIMSLIKKKQDQSRALKKILSAVENEQLKFNSKMKK